MVLFQFIIFARTQNVQSIQMPEDGEWHCQIKCSGCNQQFPKQVTISSKQKVQVIKQQVNFAVKCKNCSRKSTILIMPGSKYKANANQDNVIKQQIVAMDCRGVQVTKILLGNSFTVTGKSGTVFENADFTDLWAQFDEKLGELCQVQDVKIQIARK